MKLLNTILLLFLFIQSINSQTICGSINQNTTWQGNIAINCDVVVEEGIVLTIMPNTKIDFTSQTGAFPQLIIKGYVKAIGSKSDSIIFTCESVLKRGYSIRIRPGGLVMDSCIFDFCKFENNFTDSSQNLGGPALDIMGVSKLRLSNSKIVNNTTIYSRKIGICAGVQINTCNPFIYMNNFVGNKVVNSDNSFDNRPIGSSLFLIHSNSNIIENIFDKNTNNANGGAIYLKQSNAYFFKNTISNNKTIEDGGGIYIEKSSPQMQTNTIVNNTSRSGGGIYLTSSMGVFTDNEISNNTVQVYGGGIFLNSCDLVLFAKNKIKMNKSFTFGGGVFSRSSNFSFNENDLSFNTSKYSGGGIYVNSSGNSKMNNNLITDNLVTDVGMSNDGGGGIFICSSEIKITNCSIINNVSKGSGDGVCIINSSPVISNSIIFGKSTDKKINQIYINGKTSQPEFYYCNLQGGEEQLKGVDIFDYKFEMKKGFNINMDPNFELNSYNLSKSSPCINLGQLSSAAISADTTVDFANKPRIVGGRVDIGAFEYQQDDNVRCGVLTGNIRWSGVQKIVCDLIVEQGSTLQIEPGSHLDFSPNILEQEYITLKVLGNIIAKGGSGLKDSILFNSANIEIASNIAMDSSIFSYCIFKKALNTAISVLNFSKLNINNSLFFSNTGLKSSCLTLEKASPTITDNKFHFNSGPSISLNHSVSNISRNSFLQNRYVNEKKGSLFFVSIYNSKPIISENIFADNKEYCMYLEFSEAKIYKNTFRNNHETCIYLRNNSNSLISRNVFTQNTEKYHGCIDISSSNAKIINNIFQNNKGGSGGALSVNAGAVDLYGNVIANNTVTKSGGAIYMRNAKLNLINNTIINNTAPQFGNIAIDTIENIKLRNNIFYANTSEDHKSDLLFKTLNFSENKNSAIDPLFVDGSLGAGVDFESSIDNWTLQTNSPCKDAALLSCEMQTVLSLTDAVDNKRLINNLDIGAIETQELEQNRYIFGDTIKGDVVWETKKNKTITILCGDIDIPLHSSLSIEPGIEIQFATYNGFHIVGQLNVNGSSDSITFTVSDTTGFFNNTHLGWKGFEFTYTGENISKLTSNVQNCKIQYTKNKESAHAAISLDHRSDVSIHDSKFEFNDSYATLYLANSNISIFDNIFTQNQNIISTINCYSNSNGSIFNNKLCNNSSGHGGAMRFDLSSPLVYNNIIANNKVTGYGGACYLNQSNAEFMNNVMVNNEASLDGEELTLYYSNPTFYNNIFWSINEANKKLITGIVSSPIFLYNNIQNGREAFSSTDDSIKFLQYEHNLTFDPMFKKPSLGIGIEFNGLKADWSLRDSSQNINAGSPNASVHYSFDLGGNSRVLSGTRIDIGAYEHLFKVAPVDSLALLDFYKNTNGGKWTTNWDLSKPVSSWYGVVLNGGRVESLSLQSNKLRGSFSKSIKNIHHLNQIQLFNNHFETITPELGELPYLEILNLKNDSLKGSIPSELANAKALEVLNLSDNQLSGEINSNLANLSQLKLLELSHNKFETLANLSNTPFLKKIQLVSIAYNRLTFEDLEPNMKLFPGFSYFPQDSVYNAVKDTINLGTSKSVSSHVKGDKNKYKWTKDNKPIQNVNDSLYIASMSFSDEGRYLCEVTNPEVPGLRIYRKEIILFIKQSLDPPKVDSIKPYCVGDSTVTIFTSNPEEQSIFWYHDKELTKLIDNNYKLRFTVVSDRDTLYVIRKKGIFRSKTVIVPIVIKPTIIYQNGVLSASSEPNASYQWLFDNVILDSPLTATLTAPKDGKYRVKLTTKNKECSSLSNVFSFSNGILTGIDETKFDNEILSLYPNPSTGIVNWRLLDSNSKKIRIKVIDLSGRILQNFEPNFNSNVYSIIDLSSFLAGFYLIEFTIDGKKINKKIMKN